MVYVALDQTQWGEVNLLMVSWLKDGGAVPIYWSLLPALGSSGLKQQKSLLLKVLPHLKDYKVVVLGDREFCSVKLGRWLSRQGVYFCLRLRCNVYIQTADEIWVQMKSLELQPGMSCYFEGVKVTKIHGLGGFDVVARWQEKYRGQAPKEG